jgi:divalent metal cation (Fe/Co/Zn/Cd) transporter
MKKSEDFRWLQLALGVYILIFAIKLVVYLMSGVIALRAAYIGPDTVHAGMQIEVQSGMTIDQANRNAEEVDRRTHQGLNPGYCVIYVDVINKIV